MDILEYQYRYINIYISTFHDIKIHFSSFLLAMPPLLGWGVFGHNSLKVRFDSKVILFVLFCSDIHFIK